MGVLEDEGLSCETCTPRDKAKRGCGPLSVSGAHPTWNGRTWDGTKALLAKRPPVYDRKEADVLVINKAQNAYPHANLGDIFKILRIFWDFCPAWLSRKSNDPHLPQARDACEFAAAVRDGYAPYLRAPGDLLDAQELYRLKVANAGWDTLQARKMEDLGKSSDDPS